MQKLRNIAIIAHVDHGKTTLVDKMILAGNILRDNAKQTGELILDNNDLERERGITILSKNVSVIYKDYKINIIDTPGHADFGGEVERVLNMCDGVLLLVDAFEGTMPQTRFVLQKALALGKKPIVVINKVDKPNCRPEVVNEQVFDLMFTLDATEEQLDYKTIYGSAKQGWMSHKWNEPTDSLVPLLDAIIDEIPEPAVVEGTPQMLITSLEYSSYTGRIAVGKVTRGSLRAGQNVTLAKRDGATMQKTRIKDLMVFEGLGKKKVNEVPCGEICAILGIEGFEIGDTICDYENPEPLPPIAIDEPTMSMLFTINNSPFFGKDGKYVTSRHIKERLDRELEKNLALRVTPGPSADSFNVFGRGVLHLSVLIETMRREGYELQVGQPRVIVKEIDGKKCEPVEELTVDCPETCSGTVIELATKRKGTLRNMTSNGDRVRLEFDIPSRGIIGLRSNMLTATAGEAIMTHRLKDFEPWVGEIEMRTNGSIISGETGTAFAYSIDKLQDRGRFFINPMDQVYEGQVIGDTICDYENPEPLPPIAIDEPTMSMLFTINNSPFFGKDGKYVTSRHIKERLDRELEKNLALRVTPGPSADSFNVFGRGVLHLSVLIETMRREGYELQVGQPRVIVKEIDGKKCEPVEELTVDCPETCSGTVIELATKRKGTLRNMTSNGDRVRLEFDIPSRGIIGLRSNMLTATAGEAIMTHRLKDFEPWVGEIEMRTNGSIISGETGTAFAYSIDKLQDRGRFFINPMDQVYEGQVIGEHTRQNDITVNVTKAKQLTNMRASGSDDKTSIAPPKVFTLEEALEYIQADEYVEVTPHAMRLRKILLHEVDRKRASK